MGGFDQERRGEDGAATPLDAALETWLAAGRGATVAIVALASLEIVNAAWGRATGDALVAAAEARIAEVLAPHGEAGTMQRDGAIFYVAIAATQEAAERTLAALERALAPPFARPGGAIHLGVRIGIARAEGGTAADAIARARLALAEVRGGEGPATRVAPPAADVPLAALAADLHRAIERDEIEIVFQPQVALASGRIEAVEALARWQHPRLGPLGAGTLLAAAHRADLGLALSDHIQATALARVAGWPAALGRLRVALNLTAADVARADFVPRFLARVAASGVAPERVTAEITEGGLLDDLSQAAGLLDEVRAAGCRVAIDDFGTGYSSLAYLTALPLDYLKIDRRLTQSIDGDRRHRIVVEGVIAMAAALGLETIAEGVETEAQRALLAARGCNYYQGFLCSEPVGSEALAMLVTSAESLV